MNTINEQHITEMNRATVNARTKILLTPCSWLCLKNPEYRKPDNYPVRLATDYRQGGWHFVRLALAAFENGDEMLGNLHASCAERYFMEAELLQKGAE